ncbi:NADH:flavin oxidoreductase/NADH oxidase [Leifsonia shinshuensis]|uniref:NADH:flavin oxidoreductase/NADH oxidase n=1 Tax=Leifsonia shinshuensis TaxID=150026 RepID=UPI0028646B67|nr:NADH:flavin oxidoreductase/NADH oxidase [Leifsonia shinshuensis]MDR6973321.1 2,4-dienoyl-CoA reductase-like NADH-dependent reductase (Old Yellow Enzyme family) [Leifsonia shinshuensis]
MPSLFDPLTLRGVTARNRIWASPMCQYSVLDQSGVPNTWHLVHLGSLATGGSGIVFSEATAVSPEGRISPQDTGIWTDEQRDAWSPIVAFIEEQGAVPGIQLAHAGRKASTWAAWGFEGRTGTVPESEGGCRTVAPSAVAFEGYDVPQELDLAGIDKVVDDFRSATRRSIEAGFRVLELHAAHGYLLHEFLSPISNRRTDEYGGSLENRARLLLRVIAAVREEAPDAPLFVRFSASDWTEGGWDEHQTATVATWAQDAGADFFDISSGGIQAGIRIPLEPGYQVPFAHHVRSTSDVDVSAVGLITTPQQAAEIVESGQADAVMLARELLRDPHFPLRAAHELGVEIGYWPPQYLRARWRR